MISSRNGGIDSGAYTDLNRLQQYKLGGDNDGNIKKAAQEFESLFINQMFKAMRAGNEVFAEGNFLNSSETKTYQDMHDQQLAVNLSKEGGIGLADVLVRQMSQLKSRASRPNPFAGGAVAAAPAAEPERRREPMGLTSAISRWPGAGQRQAAVASSSEGVRDDSKLLNLRRLALPGQPQQAALDASGERPLAGNDWQPARRYDASPAGQDESVAATGRVQARARAEGGKDLPVNFDTPADFVAALMPMAEEAAQKIGVDPRYLVAQAALETGWGKSILKKGNDSSHNLFGIKSHGWKGQSASSMTSEVYNGRTVREKASFRSYDSLAQSFDDYVDFLQNNGRYRQALQQTANPERFMQELQRAGYATDPNYAQKVNQIARKLGTYQQVAAAGRESSSQRT